MQNYPKNSFHNPSAPLFPPPKNELSPKPEATYLPSPHNPPSPTFILFLFVLKQLWGERQAAGNCEAAER